MCVFEYRLNVVNRVVLIVARSSRGVQVKSVLLASALFNLFLTATTVLLEIAAPGHGAVVLHASLWNEFVTASTFYGRAGTRRLI